MRKTKRIPKRIHVVVCPAVKPQYPCHFDGGGLHTFLEKKYAEVIKRSLNKGVCMKGHKVVAYELRS